MGRPAFSYLSIDPAERYKVAQVAALCASPDMNGLSVR